MNQQWFRIGRWLRGISVACVAVSACVAMESGSERIDIPCGLAFEQGNSAVTGIHSADSYLSTVQSILAEYQSLSTALDNELRGLKDELKVTQDAITVRGSLALAISQRFQVELHAPLHVYGRQARCQPDVRQAFLDSAVCQADVGCREVSQRDTEGSYQCRGLCEVVARDDLACGPDTVARCRFRGMGVACLGRCAGSCHYTTQTTQDCPGSCVGTCDGACELAGDANGDGALGKQECVGLCLGTCHGSCEVESLVGRACDGTCDGECTLSSSNGAIDCQGAMDADCRSSVGKDFVCSERCFADFAIPDALNACAASAMCSAKARAQAWLSAACEPAVIETQVQPDKELDRTETTNLAYAQSVLELRLPVIMTLVARAAWLDSLGESLSAGTVGVKERMLYSLIAKTKLTPAEERRVLECSQPAFDQAGEALDTAAQKFGGPIAEALALQTDLVTLN